MSRAREACATDPPEAARMCEPTSTLQGTHTPRAARRSPIEPPQTEQRAGRGTVQAKAPVGFRKQDGTMTGDRHPCAPEARDPTSNEPDGVTLSGRRLDTNRIVEPQRQFTEEHRRTDPFAIGNIVFAETIETEREAASHENTEDLRSYMTRRSTVGR